jgi:serine/threonine protein kinase
MDTPSPLHPIAQTLNAYGLGKLGDGSAETVNKHLEQCPDCRKRVAEMSADSFLGRVRDAQNGSGKSAFGQSQAGGTQNDKDTNAPVPPRADTLPPGLADHPDYEIKKELGRGGMGVVYLAHNKLMGRDEVLKVIGRQIMERPGVLERFLREIRAVANLRHPNIVTAYSAVRLGESIVFAMEYVEGLDLAKMVKAKGPLPVGHACNFVYQAALGLQHAHEEGMVHRDMKPGNLMLSRKGDKAVVKVLDFGLAKATREEKFESELTGAGQMLGTPAFMAPEQFRDAQKTDIRADLYSLGCTLYYLLTGNPPFQGASLYDLFQAHHSTDAPPLNLVRPEVPVELAVLVAKMMAKEPEHRFQTPAEVAKALTPFFKKGNAAFKSPIAEVSQAGQSHSGPPVAGAVSRPAQPATGPGEPVVRPKKSAEASLPESRWESLIELRETERSTAAALAVGAGQRPPWKKWPIALAASLFGLIVLGVIIITIRDRNGREIKISVPDDSSVVVEGPRKNIEVKSSANRGEDTGATSGPTAVAGESGSPPEGNPQGPPSGHAGATGFVPLFNGKDLSGWTFPLRNGQDWTVQDGVIRGLGTETASTIATTRSDYENFHLRMEVRSGNYLSKSFLVRASYSANDVKYYAFATGGLGANGKIASLGGYRLKIGGGPTAGRQVTMGGLREITAPRVPGLAKDTWQRVEIIAVGSVFRMLVDDQEVSAFEDTLSRLKQGQIAVHLTKASHVEIRNIEIKELNEKGEIKASGTGAVGSPSQTLVDKPSVPPADAFVAGSVWVGKAIFNFSTGENNQYPANLRVLEKNGNSFRARFEIEGLGKTHPIQEVRGRVGDGKIEWLARDKTVLLGNPGPDLSGSLVGDTITLVFKGPALAPKRRGQTLTHTVTLSRLAAGATDPGAAAGPEPSTGVSGGLADRGLAQDGRTTPPADAFVAGSVWVGQVTLNFSTGTTNQRPANLRVLERNGNAFRARFEIEGPRTNHQVREVQGRVGDGKIEWLARDVTALLGNIGQDNTGSCVGDTITLMFNGPALGPEHRGQTVSGRVTLSQLAAGATAR